jgi:hypothetical protein
VAETTSDHRSMNAVFERHGFPVVMARDSAVERSREL